MGFKTTLSLLESNPYLQTDHRVSFNNAKTRFAGLFRKKIASLNNSQSSTVVNYCENAAVLGNIKRPKFLGIYKSRLISREVHFW